MKTFQRSSEAVRRFSMYDVVNTIDWRKRLQPTPEEKARTKRVIARFKQEGYAGAV